MKVTRQQPLLILAAGLVLIAMAVVVAFLLFMDDDGPDVSGTVNDSNTESKSTSGTVGGPDTVHPQPANKWSVNLSETPKNYEVDVSNTFIQNISTFSSSYWFKSEKEGSELANEWRIIDGFQALYQPEGLAAQVAQGAYYLRVETYLFQNTDGAKKAWEHFDGVLKNTSLSTPVTTKGLANNSSAYEIVSGTVGPSEIVGVFHRFSFRRGNTIVSVQTWGGKPFMNIDAAREYAAIIDAKLLGSRPATEPTPIPTPSFPGLGN